MLGGIVGPDARVAIRLKFERDRQPVVVAGPLHLVHRAGQILDMMPEFVSDDVRLSKIARSLEFPPQLFKKRKIQIEFVVARTVERARRGRGVTARRRYLPRENDQLRVLIADAALLRQYLPPGVFEAAHDRSRELRVVVLGRRPVGSHARVGHTTLIRRVLQQLTRVAAAEIDRDGQYQNPEAAAAEGYCTTAHPAAVFDIGALTLISPTHKFVPSRPGYLQFPSRQY